MWHSPERKYRKSGIRNLFLLFTALFLISCAPKTIDIQEQMVLGQRYLDEMNYEEAILAFNKVISVDPKNVEAERNLAIAYKETGKTDKAAQSMTAIILQNENTEEDLDFMNELLSGLEDLESASALTEMVYTQTGDERFIRTLIAINGKRNDFDAIERNINDAKMFKGMEDEYLVTIVQYYVDNQDLESMDKLSQLLEKQEVCDSTVLAISMWEQYMENGDDSVIKLLETYYSDEKDLPYINDDDEIYIGVYDESGQRSGYGICFYGSNVKPHSRIYAGNWEKDLRNGQGRAYLRSNYRIQCQWRDDYPVDEVNILQDDITVIGSLDDGHVATPMNLYREGEWTAVHCTKDADKKSGYSFQTVDMEKPGTCNHVKNHSYCWDCKQMEEEREAGRQ